MNQAKLRQEIWKVGFEEAYENASQCECIPCEQFERTAWIDGCMSFE